MESVDIGVSKSPAGNGVRVRVPPAAPIEKDRAHALAYIVGVALGDGNLSSPNKRVTRLRISCDASYPNIANEIEASLRVLFPKNKVSRVIRSDAKCFDISVYSKNLDLWMPWRIGRGSKIAQGARVPAWILEDKSYSEACLRGLIQTDGCIYTDRGYHMVNFVNVCEPLARDAYTMLEALGYKPRFNTLPTKNGTTKFTVKISRQTEVLRIHSLIEARKS